VVGLDIIRKEIVYILRTVFLLKITARNLLGFREDRISRQYAEKVLLWVGCAFAGSVLFSIVVSIVASALSNSLLINIVSTLIAVHVAFRIFGITSDECFSQG